MISMGYTEEEKKENFTNQVSLIEDTPQYPPGLVLRISPDQVRALGLSSVNTGDEIVLKALARVTMVQEDENFKGVEKIEVKLQITDMEVEGADKKDEEPSIYE